MVKDKVGIEESETGYKLYLGKAELSLTLHGDMAYVHDLIGDHENPTAVLKLIRAGERLGKELKVKSVVMSIGIDERDKLEAYVKLGFTISHVWLTRVTE